MSEPEIRPTGEWTQELAQRHVTGCVECGRAIYRDEPVETRPVEVRDESGRIIRTFQTRHVECPA